MNDNQKRLLKHTLGNLKMKKNYCIVFANSKHYDDLCDLVDRGYMTVHPAAKQVKGDFVFKATHKGMKVAFLDEGIVYTDKAVKGVLKTNMVTRLTNRMRGKR